MINLNRIKKMRYVRKLLLILTLTCVAHMAMADVSVEPSYNNQSLEQVSLIRAVNIIQRALPFIRAAQKYQPTQQRVTVNYQKLISDLSSVIAGMQQAINEPKIVPTLVKPLNLHFLQTPETIKPPQKESILSSIENGGNNS